MDFQSMKIKEIVYTVKYTPDKAYFESKKRCNHIIGIQLSGSARHNFPQNGKMLILEENCIYFLNQAEDYTVNVDSFGTSFSIHFTTYEPIDTESFCVKVRSSYEIERLITLAESEYFGKHNELAGFARFYELCSFFEKVRSSYISPRDLRISSAVEYMRLNFRQSDCLTNAADESGLSRRRFNELFKIYLGITPNRFLTGLRVDYAKLLLKSEYIGISRISELCGFSDVYYFSRLFKKETGFSPSEYRRLD